MNAADKEIQVRYEDLSMTIEEIAADLGFQTDAVRLSLVQNSAPYRNELRIGDGHETDVFTGLIERRAARVMEQLLDADDESVKYRAAKFIIDEVQGRNSAAVKGLKAAQNLGIGVMELNVALRKAREQRAKSVVELVPENGHATNGHSQNGKQQLELVNI